MILPSRELMPVIRAALDRGQRVRLTATGSSMRPFLIDSDVVELEPAPALHLGDIVLVQTNPPGTAERYVLHRLVRLEHGGTVRIRGDAQSTSEGPFTADALLGRVTVAWHNGRRRDLDRGWWRLAGLAWFRCAPLGCWLLWLAARPRLVAIWMLGTLQRLSSFRAWAKRLRPAYAVHEASQSELLALTSRLDANSPLGLPGSRWSADPRLTSYVARQGQQVLGSVLLVRHPQTGSVRTGYWLYNLTVRVRYRGMGIGAALTQRVIDQSLVEGATELALDVLEDNLPAIALYRKLSFEPVTAPTLEAQLAAGSQTSGRQRLLLKKLLA
jgi:ribosomal protein S18 acetylase RimI-like enzyme